MAVRAPRCIGHLWQHRSRLGGRRAMEQLPAIRFKSGPRGIEMVPVLLQQVARIDQAGVPGTLLALRSPEAKRLTNA